MDDDWNDDWEVEDDLQDPTVACPHCQATIFDDVDQCPHCLTYLSPADFRRPMSLGGRVVVVVLILSFLIWLVGSLSIVP